MLGSILDDISAQMITDIAIDRSIIPAQMHSLIDAAPLGAQQAYDAHLIDRIGYLDQIEDWALNKLGDKSKKMEAADYLSMRRDELRLEGRKKHWPTIALVQASGEIVPDAEGMARGGSMLSADKIAQGIKDAVEDKKVEAILLRIDSPGGSAVASETIRRAVELAEDSGVPVVMSMGTTAGSGAYWVAAQGDVIFADPATLTGSIGVIAGKIAGTELWEKLGINWGMITRGENADMWTVTAPFTPDQYAKVDALVGQTYAAFKNVVAEGRELNPDYVSEIAKGRVWTGAQARDLGLVDELGGFYDALHYTKGLIGMDDDDMVTLKSFPTPESATSRFLKLLDRLSSFGASMDGFAQMVAMVEHAMAPVIDLIQTQPRSLKMPAIQP
jgi:protease-4